MRLDKVNRRDLFQSAIAAAATAAFGPAALAEQPASWEAILARLQELRHTYLGGTQADEHLPGSTATPREIQAHIKQMIDDGVRGFTEIK